MTQAEYVPDRLPGRAMFDGPVQRSFPDLDPDTFWDDNEYALSAYVDAPPTPVLIDTVEAELGHRLPTSYVTLMRSHNGGMPHHTCCPAPSRTTWADTHVAVDGIMGIGRKRTYSLAGEAGSRFWIQEWGYPPIGVYFATCPSAGHDMIAFDYQNTDHGEPRVVHVDQEHDYRITVLAPNFASFIRALRPASEYEDEF
ncbi:SMI1/KNR4 family protein [Micromonospora sp. NPDC051296]|uniref:SMI1/KNR4 family protein n=1 Tax=Micromonospora sp. NPDC051296 TaxID=3155046 RepID=UPI0034261274